MPPWVTRRISDFAFAGNIGARGVSSLDGSSSAHAPAEPSTAPPTDAWRNSRREKGFMSSVQIEELVRVQEHVTEVGERLLRQERAGRRTLRLARSADEGETEGAV